MVGGAADGALAKQIVAASDGSAIDATGKLSLLASAELIGRASLLVTNDSSPLHLASAMNTPTLAIFGPTVPEFGFGPLAERADGRRLSAISNAGRAIDTVRRNARSVTGAVCASLSAEQVARNARRLLAL